MDPLALPQVRFRLEPSPQIRSMALSLLWLVPQCHRPHYRQLFRLLPARQALRHLVAQQPLLVVHQAAQTRAQWVVHLPQLVEQCQMDPQDPLLGAQQVTLPIHPLQCLGPICRPVFPTREHQEPPALGARCGTCRLMGLYKLFSPHQAPNAISGLVLKLSTWLR